MKSHSTHPNKRDTALEDQWVSKNAAYEAAKAAQREYGRLARSV